MGRLQHIFIINIDYLSIIAIARLSGIRESKMVPCIKIILDF